jgi:hypothetical protein
MNFWRKVSLYSTIVNIVVIIFLLFFKKYFEELKGPVLVVGTISMVFYIFSVLFKLFSKRQNHE